MSLNLCTFAAEFARMGCIRHSSSGLDFAIICTILAPIK